MAQGGASSMGASSVVVLDACRALQAAVHDPPRFVQVLPAYCSSLFGLEGKAWLDDPALVTVRSDGVVADEAARDAVASVVGAGSEVMRVLIESKGRPVLGWPTARLPPRLRALFVPAAQRPPRVTPPSFIPSVVPPNPTHLPLDLFLYYFFAFLSYAIFHNPYPTAAKVAPTSFSSSFITSTSTSSSSSSLSSSPLSALNPSSGAPRTWTELYLHLWRQYLALLLGSNSGLSAAAGGLSGRLKSADGAFVEATVELLIRGAETSLPGGAYVIPTVVHLQLLCLLVDALVSPPTASFSSVNRATSTTPARATGPSASPSTSSASPFSSFRNILPTSPSSLLSPRTTAPATPSGGAISQQQSHNQSGSAVSTAHPLLGLLPRPLYDFLGTAIAHFALLPPAQLQLFVRLWRLYLLPGVSGPPDARRAYVHSNLGFYTTLLEGFLTALHSGSHNSQPDARLLDQLGSVLADILVGIFDSPELLVLLRAEEAALGPGVLPPPASASSRVTVAYQPLFYNAARHPQRTYFARLAGLYTRERGVANALRMAFELTDADVGAVSLMGATHTAPAPVEPEMQNGRLTDKGAEQVRKGIRKCSPLNVPTPNVPLWQRPIGSHEWPALVRLLYRIALFISRTTGMPMDSIRLRTLACTETHVVIVFLVMLIACVYWVIYGSAGGDYNPEYYY